MLFKFYVNVLKAFPERRSDEETQNPLLPEKEKKIHCC